MVLSDTHVNSLATSCIPVGNYMFNVNNTDTRKRCEICSKLTVKTQERRQSRLWTYFTPCSSVSTVNFRQVNAD